MINYELNEQEKLKVIWTNFISNCFNEHDELFSLSFRKYNSVVFHKGIKDFTVSDIELNSVFKYGENYYSWGNNGVSSYQKDENNNFKEVPNMLFNTSYLNLINFYLTTPNKKISFLEFKKNITPTFLVEIIDFEKIQFNRDSKQYDIDNFLGKEILSKIKSKKLHQELHNNKYREKFLKI